MTGLQISVSNAIGQLQLQQQSFINFTANACNSFNMTMIFQGTVIVDWGDGTSTSITNATSSSQAFNKTYSSAFTGLVRIGGQYNNVTSFTNSVGLGISTTAKELGKFTGLLTLDIRNHLTLTGDVIDLPRVTTTLLLLNLSNATLTGNAIDLPRVTTSLILQGLPNLTLTGTTIDLPRVTTNLTLLTVQNLTLTGNAINLPLSTDIFIINTNSTITNPTNGVLKTVKSRTQISQTTKLSVEDTDRYLNDSAFYSTTWSSLRTITLSSLGRTSASDAAVTTLNGRSVTITLV